MKPSRPQRLVVYNRFEKLFQKYALEFGENRMEIVCTNMEKAVYNYTFRKINKVSYWTPLFYNLYIDKAVSMYNILNPESYLYKQKEKQLKSTWIYEIIKEQITPHELCHYHYTQLQPSLYENIQLNLNDCMRNVVTVEHDSLIQCIRCKSYKTFYKEQALRAADETVDIMVRCSLCNYIWKLDC